MNIAYRLRLGLKIAACVAVLVLTLRWRSIPAVLGPCPYDPAQPYVLGTCVRGPSAVELVVKLTLALLAIATIAVLAAQAAPKRKPIAGGVAAALSALVGLTTLQAISRQVFAVGYVPPVEAIGVVGGAFFLFGALSVWATHKWWPNKRLERSRVVFGEPRR